MSVRRRGAALESAILNAGWAQLLDAGYAGFSFEAVAERARTGKAALYRRWPDKKALLLAVLGHSYLGIPSQVPNTGSLREDVIAQLRSANERLSASAAAVLSAILGAYFDESKTPPAQLREQLLADRSLAMPQIVDRAVERGELRQSPSDRVLRLPFDLFRHEMIMNLGRVSDEAIVDIVDSVFLPLALAESGA